MNEFATNTGEFDCGIFLPVDFFSSIDSLRMRAIYSIGNIAMVEQIYPFWKISINEVLNLICTTTIKIYLHQRIESIFSFFIFSISIRWRKSCENWHRKPFGRDLPATRKQQQYHRQNIVSVTHFVVFAWACLACLQRHPPSGQADTKSKSRNMKLSCRRVSTVYKWFICGLERFNRIAFYSLVNEWQRAEPNTARQIMLLLIIISPRKKFLLLAVGNKFSTKQVYSLSFALCGYIFAAGPPFERRRCFLFHFFRHWFFFSSPNVGFLFETLSHWIHII